MEVSLRPATSADTDFARQMHHAAYRAVVERQFRSWQEDAQDAFFARDWAAATFNIVVCDGIPCGYACIEERAHAVHVRELVIAPQFQGHGVGTWVLRNAMDRARARGVPVRLGTLHANRAAALYRRLGFRETGRTDTHLLFEWAGEADYRSACSESPS